MTRPITAIEKDRGRLPETVEYTFAVFWIYIQGVSARAVAEKTGMNGGAFGFAVFSGNDSDTLTFNGRGTISTEARCNYRIKINGSVRRLRKCGGRIHRHRQRLEYNVGGTFQGLPLRRTEGY